MKKLIITSAISLLFLFGKTGMGFYAQTGIGIDCNQPIDYTTGEIYPNTTAAVVATTCTQWVRLNFILGPWSSPSDQTLHSGKTWRQTYDEIVNDFVAQGIQVYGLISDQAYGFPQGLMEQYPGTDPAGCEAWISGYTANFVEIVDYFKDRVTVFESYNEPNNWTFSSTAVVHPAWYAKILQEIYLNVKYFNGHDIDPLWQAVTVVSGAILSIEPNTGGSYINDTYWYGINVWAWDWTQAQTGSYPLDGIGFHIYVAQGSTNAATITSAMNVNTNDFWDNITFYEGAGTPKKLWVSEFGWESDAVGYSGQANNLTTSFNVLTSDTRIAIALWFCLTDWPGASWGIYEMGNFTAPDQKLSFNAFKNLFSCYATNAQAAVDCSGNVNFNWTNSGNGWWLDVSSDSNFSFVYNKDVSSLTATNAPAGFFCYVAQAPCTPPTLVSFVPGTTYYWRIFNGSVHTIGGSFMVPAPLPTTPGAISGTTTICASSTNTYSIAAVASATSYTWTLPGGWSGTSTTNSIIITAGATGGNITVTANNSCGTSAASSLAITANTIPETPGAISGTNTICASGTNTYSITAVAGATSYTWTLPGGWSGTSTTNSIITTAGATGGNITVTANNSCGTSAASSLAITVSEDAVSAANTGPYCVGATIQLNSSGGTSYSWSGSLAYTNATQNPTIAGATLAMAGVYTVTVTTGAGCILTATTTVTVSTTLTPTISIVAMPSGAICAGTNVVFTASITIGGGAPFYQWQVTGANAGTNSNTYSSSTLANGDIVACVLTSNASCASPVTVTSNSIVMEVELTATPTITLVGGVLTSSAVSGNQWYLNESILTSETLQNYIPTQNGNYTVIVTGANGCSSSASAPFNFTLLGLQTESGEQLVNIFPNPNNGTFWLALGAAMLPEQSTGISIYDILGKEIYKSAIYNQKSKIELNNITSGIYYLLVFKDGMLIGNDKVIKY